MKISLLSVLVLLSLSQDTQARKKKDLIGPLKVITKPHPIERKFNSFIMGRCYTRELEGYLDKYAYYICLL